VACIAERAVKKKIDWKKPFFRGWLAEEKSAATTATIDWQKI